MNNRCDNLCSPIAGHFDSAIASADRQRYTAKGPNRTTRKLREGIVRAGTGETVLDVGAGIGAASFELLAAGFSTALAVDISPAYVAAARTEAQTRGLTNRVTVFEGDFVQIAATLPPADTVVMDRVVCCYPNFRPLLEKALRSSNRLFAFSYPRDRWYVRWVVALENLRRTVRRSAFRTVVHSSRAMEDLILANGFRRVYNSGTLIWCVDLYHRDAA